MTKVAKDVSVRLQNGDIHHFFGVKEFTMINNVTVLVDGHKHEFLTADIDQIFIVVRKK